MSHFAKVNAFGIVENVIVAEQDFIDALPDASSWLKTSYNTRGGVHFGADGLPDGGNPLRMNFAGVGFSYIPQRDAFIPPQPYPSWVLNDETCLWEAPVQYPQDGGVYLWDETMQAWVTVFTE